MTIGKSRQISSAAARSAMFCGFENHDDEPFPEPDIPLADMIRMAIIMAQITSVIRKYMTVFPYEFFGVPKVLLLY